MAAVQGTTHSGKDVAIEIGLSGQTGKSNSTLAVGDWSITIDRGTVEVPLTGEEGNYRTQGAISVEGSVTSAKLGKDAAGIFLDSIINGTKAKRMWISGSCGSDSLGFYFSSIMITGFTVDAGDANTVSMGSVDFMVLNPADVNESAPSGQSRVWVKA